MLLKMVSNILKIILVLYNSIYSVIAPIEFKTILNKFYSNFFPIFKNTIFKSPFFS